MLIPVSWPPSRVNLVVAMPAAAVSSSAAAAGKGPGGGGGGGGGETAEQRRLRMERREKMRRLQHSLDPGLDYEEVRGRRRAW